MQDSMVNDSWPTGNHARAGTRILELITPSFISQELYDLTVYPLDIYLPDTSFSECSVFFQTPHLNRCAALFNTTEYSEALPSWMCITMVLLGFQLTLYTNDLSISILGFFLNNCLFYILHKQPCLMSGGCDIREFV